MHEMFLLFCKTLCIYLLYFRWEFDHKEDADRSIPYQLQRLFLHLQVSINYKHKTNIINNNYDLKQRVILSYVYWWCSISHKIKLEEWGANLLPSDYEADVLNIWLKAWIPSQVASSLPILIGILQWFKGYKFNAGYSRFIVTLHPQPVDFG